MRTLKGSLIGAMVLITLSIPEKEEFMGFRVP